MTYPAQAKIARPEQKNQPKIGKKQSAPGRKNADFAGFGAWVRNWCGNLSITSGKLR